MKAEYLTPEEATKVIALRKKEALAQGGISSAELAKMINKDIQNKEKKND